MNKTVGSVLDDINEWNGPNGTIYYVTAFFTDESVGSVGRKDQDAALEVQGLLRESIDAEMDFTLEAKGQTKTGKQKWNIKGFGTPSGAAIYTAPGSGDNPRKEFSDATRTMQDKAHQLASDVPKIARQLGSEQASIRASVALKAAVDSVPTHEINLILEYADAFNAWMLEKTYPLRTLTSGPASSAYGNDLSVTPPAGEGSEDPPQETRPLPADRGEGEPAVAEGEADAADPLPPHEHDWQLRQGVKGFLVCPCGKTRKKETV